MGDVDHTQGCVEWNGRLVKFLTPLSCSNPVAGWSFGSMWHTVALETLVSHVKCRTRNIFFHLTTSSWLLQDFLLTTIARKLMLTNWHRCRIPMVSQVTSGEFSIATLDFWRSREYIQEITQQPGKQIINRRPSLEQEWLAAGYLRLVKPQSCGTYWREEKKKRTSRAITYSN